MTFNQGVAGSSPAWLMRKARTNMPLLFSGRQAWSACLHMMLISGCGGIGRHARFRFWWATVQVQVLSPALLKYERVVRQKKTRHPLVFQGIRWIPCPWVQGLRFASVGAEQMSTGHFAPCHPRVETLPQRFKVVFVSLRSAQSQGPPDLVGRSAPVGANERPPDVQHPVTRMRVETLSLRLKVVSVLLRSVQDQRPPDVADRLRFGRCSTKVPRTLCTLSPEGGDLVPEVQGLCGGSLEKI